MHSAADARTQAERSPVAQQRHRATHARDEPHHAPLAGTELDRGHVLGRQTTRGPTVAPKDGCDRPQYSRFPRDKGYRRHPARPAWPQRRVCASRASDGAAFSQASRLRRLIAAPAMAHTAPAPPGDLARFPRRKHGLPAALPAVFRHGHVGRLPTCVLRASRECGDGSMTPTR